MARPSNTVKAYLETGSHRVFAGALEWPGWCRSGRNAEAALQALAVYGLRYAKAMESAKLTFEPPADAAAFDVVERLKGNSTTDFGSPGIPPKFDARPLDAAELRRAETILKACWRTFDAAVLAAGKKELRKGPRGGGRELDEIVRHIIEADAAYLGKVGLPFRPDPGTGAEAELRRTRAAILESLTASVQGKMPAKGPRGAAHWTARYFVRRTAWHALDHAWEIEDRME